MEAIASLLIELSAICRNHAEKMANKNSSNYNSTEAAATAAPVHAANANVKRPSTTGLDSSAGAAQGKNDCLFLQLTRCFRKRLFKMWERIIESDRISISYTTAASLANLQQPLGGAGTGGGGGGGGTGGSAGGDHAILSSSLQSDFGADINGNGNINANVNLSMIMVDEHAPYMKYIEDTAFKVPHPVTSAGNIDGWRECKFAFELMIYSICLFAYQAYSMREGS